MENVIVHGKCEDVFKSICNESVDLIVTDPPYGISYHSNSQGVDRKIRNATNKSFVVREKFFEAIAGDSELPVGWLKDAYRVLRPNSAIYIFCRWDKWDKLKPAVCDAGFIVKNMIVLRKSNHGMGDLKGQFAPKHELLLFATKGRHLLRFPPRKPDVWDVPVKFSGSHRLHPNEKPVSWVEPAIRYSSDPGDLVLDPFAGSGTTLYAAKSLGRKYIGIELDEYYVQIARQRLE